MTDAGDSLTGGCGDGTGPEVALPALLAGPGFELACDVVIVISPLEAASLWKGLD